MLFLQGITTPTFLKRWQNTRYESNMSQIDMSQIFWHRNRMSEIHHLSEQTRGFQFAFYLLVYEVEEKKKSFSNQGEIFGYWPTTTYFYLIEIAPLD